MPLDALAPDVFALILSKLGTADLLSAACTCRLAHAVCDELLRSTRELALSGSTISAASLDWLVRTRMGGSTRRLDVGGCPHLSKAHVVKSVRDSRSIESLVARNVGLGSWTCSAISNLVHAAPPSLRDGRIELDCRVVINQDLSGGSRLTALLAQPSLCVRRLVVVKDFVGVVSNAGHQVINAANLNAHVGAGGTVLAAAPTTTDPGAEVAATESAVDAAASESLRRLQAALSSRADLWTLDGSSGALGRSGVENLVAPLLRAPGCALRWLACSDVPRDAMQHLVAALPQNSSLLTLQLGCNCLSMESALLIATAIEKHPSLTTLMVEHNPILDAGAAAIASTLEHNRIKRLSLAFTGAADGACEMVARAIAAKSPLMDISICGNGVGSEGAENLARAIGMAGETGNLQHLRLSANQRITAAATCELARNLADSPLRSLELAGTNVNPHACSLFAASLPMSRLEVLDLASNHFGCEGAWSLAWSLPDCPTLRTLNLADCAIGDDGGDEIADALNRCAERSRSRKEAVALDKVDDIEPIVCGRNKADGIVGKVGQETPVGAAKLCDTEACGDIGNSEPKLFSLSLLDLRGNRLSPKHRLALDPRVNMNFQHPVAARAQ